MSLDSIAPVVAATVGVDVFGQTIDVEDVTTDSGMAYSGDAAIWIGATLAAISLPLGAITILIYYVLGIFTSIYQRLLDNFVGGNVGTYGSLYWVAFIAIMRNGFKTD